jgi:hypothetical protein
LAAKPDEIRQILGDGAAAPGKLPRFSASRVRLHLVAWSASRGMSEPLAGHKIPRMRARRLTPATVVSFANQVLSYSVKYECYSP